MRFAIRTDASFKIGSGHVMRCLTLADALSELGNKVVFICKDHDSNLIHKITDSGYEVKEISVSSSNDVNSLLAHSGWLGGTQEDDAEKTIAAIKSIDVHWMIVDHYAIDESWHKKIRPYANRICVIDDLGDRNYDCDILMDQNLGATLEKYKGKAPKDCEFLLGPKYALLRPEFAQWRDTSLERRRHVAEPKNIFVSLGGVDPQNITTDVINELSKLFALVDAEVNVVLGSQSPHINAVENAAKKASFKINVHVDSTRMAELMSQADLAIGASGSSSWERCALGLPTISYVIAENQKAITVELAKNGVSMMVNSASDLAEAVDNIKRSLNSFSLASAGLVDAMGASRVIECLLFKRFNILINDFNLTANDLSTLPREKIIEVLEARNHPDVRSKMLNKNIISLEEHLAFVENLLADNNSRQFMIRQDDDFVGVVNFKDIDWVNKSATFGIYANLLRKVSMAGDKLMIAADFIIKKIGLISISLRVESGNFKAQNLYEKWGYEVVGSEKVNGLRFINYEKIH